MSATPPVPKAQNRYSSKVKHNYEIQAAFEKIAKTRQNIPKSQGCGNWIRQE